MPITIGAHLGSHEITALHGTGRMGEVYRVRDTKLKRQVGLKILPEEFSRNADRVGRFQREVDVLASLNHPNICRKVPRAVRGGAMFSAPCRLLFTRNDSLMAQKVNPFYECAP